MSATRNPDRPPKLPPTLADYAAAARQDTVGLTCGKCGCQHFHVVNTRMAKGSIKRYRVCRNCGKRIVTYERSGAV